MDKQAPVKPILFGEVLFDCFPDSSVVMGGAPLNVAWHLKGFGLNPLLISRVGDDDYAGLVMDNLIEWGLDITGIQVDKTYPTGRVEITLQDGQPDFSILPDQAYDYINSETVEQVVASLDSAMLYHGSLAARNAVSMQALQYLRKRYSNNLFVDINLRQPWWNPGLVNELAASALWLKLNDIELSELSGNNSLLLENVGQEYARQNDIAHLILTLGEKGVYLIERDNLIHGAPVLVDQVVDTVGAGDAFSSVMILGITHGWDSAEALPRALEFASYICTVRGATISNHTVYKKFLENWGVS